jgi:hypothetical protein
MVKRSPTTLTVSPLTHDLKTPFAGLGMQNGPGQRLLSSANRCGSVMPSISVA